MTSSYAAIADFERVPPELVRRAAGYQSTTLCDVAGRRGSLNSRIQALNPGMKLAGPAFTVELRRGDNLMFHLALLLARPGDVIVVDAKNEDTCALFGELMVVQATAAGLGGFVVDGPLRDSDALMPGPFPVFATGRNASGPTKALPGLLGRTIAMGGVAVNPGDLVVGDADGVVVLPRQDVGELLDAADRKLASEQERLAEIARGEMVVSWLNPALRGAGLPAYEP